MIKIIRASFIIITLTAVMPIACESGSDSASVNHSGEGSNISGRWETAFTDSSSDEDNFHLLWILQQSGSEITQIYGFNDCYYFDDFSVNNNRFSFSIVFDSDSRYEKRLTGSGLINGNNITGSFLGSSSDPEDAPFSGTFYMSRISNSFEIPVISIPSASITVDGLINDWDDVNPIMTDVTGDSSIPGTDIHRVKIAVNEQKNRGFALIKIANGNISTACAYRIRSDLYDFEVVCKYEENPVSSWKVRLFKDGSIIADNNAVVAINSSFIEFSFAIPIGVGNFDLEAVSYQSSPYHRYDEVNLFDSGYCFAMIN